MSQEKTAEIIDLSASRAAAAGDGAGPFLASARLAAGLDIPDVATATKIKASHIEAIETGNTAALPATPYAVGFVRVYAAYLGLDADAIAAEFRKEVTAARPEPALDARAASVPAYEASPGVKVISLFGIMVILGFAIWIIFQIAGKGGAGENADAANEGPRVRVSEVRAEAPRPRILAPGEYEVVPIPPVGGDPAAAETADENPLDALSAPEETALAAGAADDAPVSDEPITDAPLLSTIQPEGPPANIDSLDAETPTDTAPAPEQPDILPTEISPAVIQPAAPQAVIVDARLIRSIGPKYPARCERGAGALETVSVIFDVNANGRPTNPRVTASSNDCFEDAAVAAVTKWRFDPRTVNGAPRPQKSIEATLNFRR